MRDCTLKDFRDKITKKNTLDFPYSVMFAITQRCNLNCKFCSLGSNKNSYNNLSKEKLFRIVNELFKTPCFLINLTGGEPLIRNDFLEVYNYIRKKGFLVTIFTNGTLINKKLVSVWKDNPPHNIRISLYAGSQEGYYKICKDKKAYNNIIKSAELLKRNNIYFTFRSVLNKLNIDELDKMINIAKRFNVPFSVGTKITQDATGNKEPISLNISDIKLNEIKEKYPQIKKDIEKLDKLDKGWRCDGCIYISNKGVLKICPVMNNKIDSSVENLDIKEFWMGKIDQKIKLKCPCS